MGDKSDNIPGAFGIGEKTALKLIQAHNSVEQLYKVTNNEKLLEQKDTVLLSKKLAAIDTNVPLDYDPKSFSFSLPLPKEVFDAFKARKFHSLCDRKNLWQSYVDKPNGCISLNYTQEDTSNGSVAGKNGNLITEHGNGLPSGVAPEKTPSDDILKNKPPEGLSRNIPPDDTFKAEPLTDRDPVQLSFLVLEDKKISTAEVPIPPCNPIDSALEPVLAKMSLNGAKIDLEALQRLFVRYSAEITAVADQIYALAGEKFNINSPAQLGTVLYKKLGIETQQRTKNGQSTNEAVLRKIEKKSPIVSQILRYRKAYKLYSTYLQGYKNQVDANGFIHSNFKSSTSTGRLSSSEPNLQNIPARGNESAAIRSLFISRFTNGRILTADYSQIELRILAHLSGDELMRQAFKNSRDIHDETAHELGIDRRSAKVVNFGIIYGQTAFGLAETLGVPVANAAKIIENYFARFPRIKEFLDSCRDFAASNGYIETIYGRRRYLPELNSTNHNIVGMAARAAINMPMQGATADIIKKAMIAVDAEIVRLGYKSVLINQIHDELVFDCPYEEVSQVSLLVKNIMENVVKLDIPLAVDIKVKNTL
jgi:hypothetical protein